MYDYEFDSDDDYDFYDEPSPRRRSGGCVCGYDLPGTCPGQACCLYANGSIDDGGEDE